MRVAKYDANPDNPTARETLRFRFSNAELEQMASRYGNGDPRKLRFRLEIDKTEAKLVPTENGGMAVTRSPSGKNYPWEVGFNHKSSPDITKVNAIPTSDAEMRLARQFLSVRLPQGLEAAPRRRASANENPRVVSVSDFSADLRSPADIELLRQAIRTVNEVSGRLAIPLDLAEGKVRAYVS